MFDKQPSEKPPGRPPRDHDKPQAGRRPPRDMAREDADSPSAIPILPPRGDGS